MNKPLSFSEVNELIDTLSVEEAMNDPRITEFVGTIESCGKELLLNKIGEEDLGNYLLDVSSLLTAAVAAEFLKDIDFKNTLKVMGDLDFIKKVVVIAFIYSIGLGIAEELH